MILLRDDVPGTMEGLCENNMVQLTKVTPRQVTGPQAYVHGEISSDGATLDESAKV